MASHPSSPTQRRRSLEDLYAPIAAELQEVEAVLAETLESPLPYVRQLTEHTARYGGKRVRPALLLFSAAACGRVQRNHVVLAAVMEMIHTATLVHDDLLDGADLRRHVPTVHAAWGQESGILLGDYLFSQAFWLAAGTGSAEACRTIGEATSTVCAGELAQTGQKGCLRLSEAEYLDVIERKTASLTACSCRLGAKLAGAEPAWIAALGEYGRLVGLAFQIVDDVLDLVGREAAMGKSLGTDIREHKATLPLIRLLAEASPQTAGRIQALWESDDPADMERLRSHVADGPYLQSAFEAAVGMAEQACAQLACLPATPGRSALEELAGFVTDRRF